MKQVLLKFRDDENGATAIEYGLICAAIALAIIGGTNNIADELIGTFTEVQTQLQTR
jgi:pilus assembly protein Flp/PilA